MDARVVFSRETRQKLSNVINEEHRAKLRTTRVMEFIDQYPAGKEIVHMDVIRAAGFDVSNQNEYFRGRALIERMIKQGLIEHDGQRRSRAAHYKVKKTTLEVVHRTFNDKYSTQQIEQEARNFLWDTGSDSLREFIKHLTNKVKETNNG